MCSLSAKTDETLPFTEAARKSCVVCSMSVVEQETLESLMTQHAVQDVQTRVHTIVYRASTVEAQYAYEDVKLFYRVGLPFFQKWVNIPSDYQQIYQQALREMQQPDFVSTWTLLTAWGTKPMYGEPLLMRGLR